MFQLYLSIYTKLKTYANDLFNSKTAYSDQKGSNNIAVLGLEF